MEARDVIGVVLRVQVILVERHRVLDFNRRGPDRHVDVEAAQPFHEFDVEIGDRHRRQRKTLDAAGIPDDAQFMVDKIEQMSKVRSPQRFCDATRPRELTRKVDVPPMIDERRAGRADTLPATCVHNCSVSQVSLHASNGRSGQCEFQLIGTALQQMPELLETN